MIRISRLDLMMLNTLKKHYKMLQAQISVYFGIDDGTLAGLQKGFHNLIERKPIRCESCKAALHRADDRHKEDCEIVKKYWELFRNE